MIARASTLEMCSFAFSNIVLESVINYPSAKQPRHESLYSQT